MVFGFKKKERKVIDTANIIASVQESVDSKGFDPAVRPYAKPQMPSPTQITNIAQDILPGVMQSIIESKKEVAKPKQESIEKKILQDKVTELQKRVDAELEAITILKSLL